jgi:hypothetical protein
VAEVEATGHREPRDDGGVLVDDDEARIEEEHREARIAMNAAILQMPWLWGRAAVPTTGPGELDCGTAAGTPELDRGTAAGTHGGKKGTGRAGAARAAIR